MIELRWKNTNDDNPKGVINGLQLPIPLLVLQYRWNEIISEDVSRITEWKDVEKE